MAGESCLAHRSKDDMKFISYKCPLIATLEQCINPEHSEMDHGKKNTGRIVNFLTRLRHEEMEEKKKCLSEDEGIVEDEEEGWSYDTGKSVMVLTQRTAQQMNTLTPTMKI